MRERRSARSIGLVAVLIAALLVAWTLLRSSDRVGREAAPGAGNAVEAVRTDVARPAERVAAERGGVAERGPSSEAAPATVGPPEQDSPVRLRIDGRVVDLEGWAIAGAEVRTNDARIVAVSDEEGRIDAALELGDDALLDFGWGQELELHTSAPGRRSAYRRVDVASGEVVHLGTLRLGLGGDAIGRVLDESGAPLDDAWVGWRDAAAWPKDEEEARRVGIEFGVLRDSDDNEPETWTDAEGRFLLRGLPEGELFLVANDEQRLYAWSDVFALRAGDTVERTLVLVPDPRHATVRGRVLDPGGRPVAGARVGVVGAYSTRGAADADAEGRFVLERFVEEDETRPPDLVAWDPEERWSPSEPVVAGDAPVELVLAPARHIEVHTTDASGSAIPWGHVRFVVRRWNPTHRGDWLPLGREGRARFLCPRGRFEVEALAPGWRATKLGPFEAASVSDPLVLVLEPGDAVRGRVTAGGRPLAGARVGVKRTRDPSRLGLSWTLAPLDRPFTASGTARGDPGDATTGRDGRFTITLHDDGWHSVTIAAEGFPTTFFGPFEWKRSARFAEVELAMERAGALEGRVLVPPGREPAGRIVGASNGWGIAWTAAVDAEGLFRIDGLAPGPYQLRPCLPPAASRQEYHDRLPEEGAPGLDAIAWDVHVSAGETTRFDLDLRDEEDFVLSGRFAFDGAPGLWSVRLLPREPARGLAIAAASLAADGTFELRLSRGGPVVLELRSDWRRFRQELDLAPGNTQWTAEIPLATLDLRGAPPRAPDGREQGATYRWRGADGLTFRGWWYTASDSGTHVVPMPAGSGELEFSPNGDEAGATGSLALDLAPGSHTVLDLSEK